MITVTVKGTDETETKVTYRVLEMLLKGSHYIAKRIDKKWCHLIFSRHNDPEIEMKLEIKENE